MLTSKNERSNDYLQNDLESGQVDMSIIQNTSPDKDDGGVSPSAPSADQSMVNDNNLLVYSQISQSVRFYDPSETSSCIQYPESGLLAHKSNHKNQIRSLNKDKQRLKNQIHDLKKRLDDMYNNQQQSK